MMRKRDATNQIKEETPKSQNRFEKPKTGSIENSKRNYNSNQIITAKVDINSKSSTNFRKRKPQSSSDFLLADRVL